MKALDDKNRAVAIAAAMGLADLGDVRSVEPLLRATSCLKHPDGHCAWPSLIQLGSSAEAPLRRVARSHRHSRLGEIANLALRQLRTNADTSEASPD